MEKNVNFMGLNKFQVASIKRTFASNKKEYSKLETLNKKIKALQEEAASVEQLTEAWELPVKALTKQVTGFELTSQQVLHFLDHEQDWLAFTGRPTEEAQAAIDEKQAVLEDDLVTETEFEG